MSTTVLPTFETAKKLGLLPEEYDRIVEILGRKPNFTELSIFSVMWSEHCSYKNSIVWLKTLPKESPRMLAKAGEENAGLVDVGQGLAIAFKIESHNHPSALEPYQGAATGVGGINRDIFTMGARPVAQLNSLRFGLPDKERNQFLIKGVVKGIGDYGNAFGIPTVGGEVFFDECYNTNPLVNAFSAGVVKIGNTAKATSYGVGNPVYIVGSRTGKDGIHGATFASEDITEKSNEKLPAVQVGDPFAEKLLLEATLEVIASGAVIGIQDMGAAGIICSTSEMSAKGEHGMDIWLDKVPTRQANMKPFEILLSESQERMLIVVDKGREEEVLAIFDKWDLPCACIGVVTDTKRLHFYMDGELEADVPADDLVLGGGAPVYHREWKEPAYYAENQKFDPASIEQPDYAAVARYLLQHPNLASKKWVSRQYDSMVGTANVSAAEPSDASVVLIKDAKDMAMVLTVDCNSRYVHADPEKGCAIAVAEAARNIVCSGGEPVAITNCLNFGNPYNPEVYWQFVHSIKGMKTACEAFQTPVTGGNVSFYNQSGYDGPVFPTPTIGMLGLMEGLYKTTTIPFKKAGHKLALLGPMTDDIACSEYLYSYCGVKSSPAPSFNMESELATQKLVKKLIKQGIPASCHDLSDGGLFHALAECSLLSGLGFEVCSTEGIRKDAFWFGEGQSRVLISYAAEYEVRVVEMANEKGVDFLPLGLVTETKQLRTDGQEWLSWEEAKELNENGLSRFLEK
jgi:phosphoribosylformylglycinamidine synthase subunit PurL